MESIPGGGTLVGFVSEVLVIIAVRSLLFGHFTPGGAHSRLNLFQ
jgi:hypothetical protein